MSNHITPTARFIDEYRLELRSRYHAGLVQELKSALPADVRFWDPMQKVWLIESTDPYWLEVALGLFEMYFPYCDVVRPGGGSAPIRADDAYRVLWLIPGAPAPIVKAVYRAMSLMHHPDKGGTTSDMQRVNAAYAALQEVGAA